MNSTIASVWRTNVREKSCGNHRCRISMTFLAATLAGLIFEFSAHGQATVPIAANAFRPSGALVRGIQRAGEIDQGPQTGAYELQFWSAGGDGVRIAPSNPKGSFWNIGIRFGYVVTGEHGRGPLRGRFEYVADVIPVIHFHFPGQTVWGGGIVPVGMKWDFVTRHRIAPYAEVNGGGLVASQRRATGRFHAQFYCLGFSGCACAAREV